MLHHVQHIIHGNCTLASKTGLGFQGFRSRVYIGLVFGVWVPKFDPEYHDPENLNVQIRTSIVKPNPKLETHVVLLHYGNASSPNVTKVSNFAWITSYRASSPGAA